MKPKYWLIFGAVAACAAQTVSCTSDFSSCQASRTCPAGGASDAGEAGEEEHGAAGAHAGGAGGAITAGSAGATDDVAGSTSDGGSPTDGGAAGEPNVMSGGAGGSVSSGGTAGLQSGGAGGNVAGAGGSVAGAGPALKADGATCTAASECTSNACTLFHHDQDGDHYGSATDTQSVCGTAAPLHYTADANDCCDTDPDTKPNQTMYFAVANACGNFDYNCAGGATPDYASNPVSTGYVCSADAKSCSPGTAGWQTAIPACGTVGGWLFGCSVVYGCGQLHDINHAAVACH